MHSLWAPATVLKMPLVMKPGSAEPWTPYRMIQAWLKAGCPPEAFGYYPSDHAGGNEILRRTGRGMVFGDVKATERWRADPRVEIHGPGFSKVVLGADTADDWERYLDVMVTSIVDNGGRSCVNASSVWVPKHGREIAEALAERFAAIAPRAADDEAAQIAPFVDPAVAERINADDRSRPRAAGRRGRHSTAASRGTAGCAGRARPTCCRPWSTPIASTRSPIASSCSPSSASSKRRKRRCPSVSATRWSSRRSPTARRLRQRLIESPLVDRLNLGPIPTVRIGWDQPHEGNLFEHLYARRAIQRSA